MEIRPHEQRPAAPQQWIGERGVRIGAGHHDPALQRRREGGVGRIDPEEEPDAERRRPQTEFAGGSGERLDIVAALRLNTCTRIAVYDAARDTDPGAPLAVA